MLSPENQLRLKLNNGDWMPAVACGAAIPKETTGESMQKALELGYRHFDTAQSYGRSEELLGTVLQEAFKRGLVKREDLFITTKIWPVDLHPPDIIPALKRSLRTLQLDYVDMYLIHWPVRLRPEAVWPNLSEEDYLPLDMPGCWKVLEECVHLGLTKGIGVSNWSVKNLKALVSHATIIPAVNQIERHPGLEQTPIVNYCKQIGTVVTGYSALGGPGYRDLAGAYGTTAVLESPVLAKIGAKYDRTSAQVALRWALDTGCGLVVKSANPTRLAQNVDLFDFSLTEEDLEEIKKMPEVRGLSGEWFVGPGSPYKTIDDLWADE
ncbi:hypothetical protein R1sor_020763 [Riccia sorocarpa]|uniref:NADP-dependent oxidoreductase domain-containing protein n=1 Tax=Riccia sorocarpa TaxID=122646 RepID=A0ABD3GF43_9MARC